MNEHPTQENEVKKGKTPGRLAHISKKLLFFGALALIFTTIYVTINIDTISGMLGGFFEILTPVIIGCVIAYLCNPILEFYEYRVLHRMSKNGIRRGLALFLAILTMIGLIALLFALIIPELLESIINLATNYEVYFDSLLGIAQNIINGLAENFNLGSDVIQDVQQLKDMLFDFLGEGEELAQKVIEFLENLGLENIVMSVVGVFFDIILGIFIALYILSSKEKRIAQIRKFRRAVFSEKENNKITEVTNLISRTFDGYVFGVLIDALVVGILTFTLLSIFEISPYNLLIATLCAITNIIPVFGPFIGAIPSAFIVLISNPSKFFLFIILVVIIQQIDGNLLCPKIQGDNTGISSLAVLITITVAGAKWGVIGLIIGVPICAVIIELVKRFLDGRLEAMGQPTDTVAYYPEDALGNAEKDVHYEHSALLYEYEHGGIKKKLVRIKRKMRVLLTAKAKPCGDAAKKPAEQAENKTTPEAVTDTSEDTSESFVPDTATVTEDSNTPQN